MSSLETCLKCQNSQRHVFRLKTPSQWGILDSENTYVCLGGGVVGRAGVDAPGADAQGGEARDGPFVVACYLSV